MAIILHLFLVEVAIQGLSLSVAVLVQHQGLFSLLLLLLKRLADLQVVVAGLILDLDPAALVLDSAPMVTTEAQDLEFQDRVGQAPEQLALEDLDLVVLELADLFQEVLEQEEMVH
jgi:hypothetical protein